MNFLTPLKQKLLPRRLILRVGAGVLKLYTAIVTFRSVKDT
jgi:hypothetical protein